MWLIPRKTKVKIELIRGVSITDMIVAGVSGIIIFLAAFSSFSFRWILAGILLFIAIFLLVRIDSEPNYMFFWHLLLHFSYKRSYQKLSAEQRRKSAGRKRKSTKSGKGIRSGKGGHSGKGILSGKGGYSGKSVSGKESMEPDPDIEELIGFTKIENGFIHYGDEYFGSVLEIPPVEFRFFSDERRTASITNGLGRVLRTINADYSMNLVKIERPVNYDTYLASKEHMLDELRGSYEQGVMTEEEFQVRTEILMENIKELHKLSEQTPVIIPFYYLVFYDKSTELLEGQIRQAASFLRQAELSPKRLNDKELAVFLRYSNELDFDEREIEKVDPADYARWAMPDSVFVSGRSVAVNGIKTNNMRVVRFPIAADDAWLATVMSIPSTKVVLKCRPMDRTKAIRRIDWALQELRVQYNASGSDSRHLDLQDQINTLTTLLSTLQNDNETLLNCNVYVTTYDLEATNKGKEKEEWILSDRYVMPDMKRTIRRAYQEREFRLNNMDFEQMKAFIATQVSGYDPFENDGCGIPSNSVSAAYPWIFSTVSDEGGIKLGVTDSIPVFLDFFKRDSEHVNSNLVIIGKSGSGKSYATKSLLTGLATEDAKIFILDPENEYSELAANLHGKFINVGNAQYGRLNPFQIITVLDDDEDKATVSGSYSTHLQFLEEFFRQILPDCEKDALEYLNNLIDRMYYHFNITGETNLANLTPKDYPVFDDLYDIILEEFQTTENEYLRTMLRTLMNYVAKFSGTGRNANIWNGPSTVTTDENFTVFNFQSLLSNRNQTIANAQMLLVLKYIDNEIIKNREYNERYHSNRKIVVVIDEAHVFIDEKFPIALDFMFQLAKRIRKYNGMQIVITQNIKDFVGSEELAKKSTAIINACQYSMIFSLAPNDMGDLCSLYEKAGGINESEKEHIVSAPRGQAFTIMSPTSRTTIDVETPDKVVELFQKKGFVNRFEADAGGMEEWDEYIGDSRQKHDASLAWKREEVHEIRSAKKRVTFEVVKEKDLEEAAAQKRMPVQKTDKMQELKSDLNRNRNQNPDLQQFRALIPQMQEAVQQTLQMQENVQQAPQMQEVVQQPTQVNLDLSSTNALLSAFLEKFSRESIQQEVERSVREALERSGVNTEDTAAIMNKPNDSLSENPLPEDTDSSRSYTEESPLEYEAQQDLQQNSDDSDDIDIMELLFSEAEKRKEQSVIDQMEYYDEKVIEIKLEDLIQYTRHL